MTTFQEDVILTLNENHNYYLDKFNTLKNNKELIKNLSIDKASKLINYIKEYKHLINSINIIIDKINNINNELETENKIEKELLEKIVPIMNVYRTLLYEKYTKYNNSTNRIYDQD